MRPMVIVACRKNLPALDHDGSELEAHWGLGRHLSALGKIKLRLVHVGYMRSTSKMLKR